jgi:hypothetical protein
MGSFLDQLIIGIKQLFNNGAQVTPFRPAINLIGATVSDNPSLNATNVQFTGGSGGGGSLTIEHNGTGLPLEPALNFVDSAGIAYTVTDDAAHGRTNASVALVNTAVTPGTYGDATHVGQVAVAADGRVTGASNVAITFPQSGVNLTNNGSAIANNPHPTLNNPAGGATWADSGAGVATLTMPAGVGPVNSGLVAARPSATGSGALYFCDDLPVVYVDDPSLVAWKQYHIGGYVPKPDVVANWTTVGPISIFQKGDSIVVLSNATTQVSAVALKAIGGATAPWQVRLAGLPFPSMGQGTGAVSPEFGVCVSNGVTSGTSVLSAIVRYYNTSSAAGGVGTYTAATLNANLPAAHRTLDQAAAQLGVPMRTRIVNDSVNLVFQYSDDGELWRSFDLLTLPAGLTQFGFVLAIANAAGAVSGGLVEMCQLDTMSTITITNMTYATPTVTVTAAGHGLVSGQEVSITGVVSTGTLVVNTGPSAGTGQEGWVPITRIDANTFSFVGTAAQTFGYTSGGKVLNLSS